MMKNANPNARPGGRIMARMAQPNASMSALSMPKPAGPVVGPGPRGQVDRSGLGSLYDGADLQGGLNSKKAYSGGLAKLSTRSLY